MHGTPSCFCAGPMVDMMLCSIWYCPEWLGSVAVVIFREIQPIWNNNNQIVSSCTTAIINGEVRYRMHTI